jgi:hypothetical protein
LLFLAPTDRLPILLTLDNPARALLGTAVVALGFPVYLVLRRSKPPAGAPPWTGAVVTGR